MITVIIPHLNDAGLEMCLACLDKQTGYDGDWEVLVCDNGSAEPPEALCAAYDRVTMLIEKEPGPGPARNMGAAHAKGDILAFTDADCNVAEDWLAQIAKIMSDPSVKLIGGAVNVAYDDPENPTFTEPFERVYSFRNDLHISQGYSASANLAVRKEVFETVGGFKGRDTAEDQEWGLRATALGFTPDYHPEVIVHNAPRTDMAALKRKWARHIAHDLEARGGGVSWILRAFALMLSSPAELPTIMTTPKLGSLRERFLCFVCLTRIRIYRGMRMLSPNRSSIVWND